MILSRYAYIFYLTDDFFHNFDQTIMLNQTVAGVSHGTVLSWARETTPLYAGPLDSYDHVMYFMPPGVAFNGAAAFGYMPGRETWYMDSYSLKTG